MQPRVVAFTSSYDRPSNVLINKVYISEVVTSSSPRITRPKSAKEYKALWDTGATGSVITRKVVDECGLKPIGRANVHHAKGTSSTLVYLVSVFLPNNVCFHALRVTEGDLVGDVEVLIGMDIISRGDFAISNKDGKTTFTFRMPSLERIDFVEQVKSLPKARSLPLSRKVGRNDPCPCGSGKKYKKCCGK
ncbi:MAG: SEC-C metal-binding domain-containing protein [Chloroflexota bacterium]|nr:SEC-C domain-containing protein [Chloroflexota bacterium]